MRLVIHCGFHKTATTSFQTLCAKNRSLLYELGVNYPRYGSRFQHSYVLWEAQKSGLDVLETFLSQSFADAKSNCHTVLLSGEDFENCIVDVALASEIEALAIKAGFDSTEWVVVTRSVETYISSIYSQMSKHGVVLRRDTLERVAKERGCFYISADNYNYIIVFDFLRFAERFKRHISGHIIEYSFEDFVHEYPGKLLLQRLLQEEAFTRFWKLAKVDHRKANERLACLQIEANYISSALGITRLRDRPYRVLTAPLVWLRRASLARKNAGQ